MSETDQTIENGFKELEPIGGTAVSPGVGVAAIALQMALKYCDIGTVQEGALYQQYKLEGRNLTPLHLDVVFETAIRMEQHLIAGSQRIADLIVGALEAAADRDEDDGDAGGEGVEGEE